MPEHAYAQDSLPQPAPALNTEIIALPDVTVSSGDYDFETPTHPPLRLTPDKSEIIVLDRDAHSVIIGNPDHLNIIADAANRLIVVPRSPGASFFAVLDIEGRPVMQRHVIVGSPKEHYLRIRRSCAGENSGTNCTDMRVYYCPDMCHEIAQPEDNKAAASPTAPRAGSEDAAVTPSGGEPVP